MTAAQSPLRSPIAPFAEARRFARQVLRQPFHRDYKVLAHITPRPGQLMIDAGAFDGQAIDAIRLYHPDTPICAFEPVPARARALAERFMMDPNLAVYGCGLGETEAEAMLAAPVRGGTVDDARASFDARHAAKWGEIRALETKVFPLDDLEFDVAVLKIAVNGLEYSVLKGARETLERCEPLVLCALDEAADTFLTQELGWMRAGYDGERLVPGETGDRHAFYAGPRCEAVLWGAGLVV